MNNLNAKTKNNNNTNKLINDLSKVISDQFALALLNFSRGIKRVSKNMTNKGKQIKNRYIDNKINEFRFYFIENNTLINNILNKLMEKRGEVYENERIKYYDIFIRYIIPAVKKNKPSSAKTGMNRMDNEGELIYLIDELKEKLKDIVEEKVDQKYKMKINIDNIMRRAREYQGQTLPGQSIRTTVMPIEKQITIQRPPVKIPIIQTIPKPGIQIPMIPIRRPTNTGLTRIVSKIPSLIKKIK